MYKHYYYKKSFEKLSSEFKTIQTIKVKQLEQFDIPELTLDSFFTNKKVVLIVNVCGSWLITKENFMELNELYSAYSQIGLEILGFICS